MTYYRRSRSNKRADAQFFFRLAADGVRYGFHLGRSAARPAPSSAAISRRMAKPSIERSRRAILLNACQFWVGDDLGNEVTVHSAADLRAWAANKTLAAGIASHRMILPCEETICQAKCSSHSTGCFHSLSGRR